MHKVSINDFLGLNNILSPEEFVRKENFKTVGYYLKTATNIDLDNVNKPRRRSGYTEKYDGNVHSLWSNGAICLFREGEYLKRLDSDFTTATTLRSGITGNLTMSYVTVDNKVYYSDGNITGIIENGVDRSWGLPVPPTPAISATWGSLAAGIYQACITYVRNDGQESGASESVALEVSSNAGITITGITASTDPGVSFIRIYATQRDSGLFYRLDTLANTSQTYSIYNLNHITAIPLRTQFLSPPPAGQLLEYDNGRIHIASFDVDYYTNPFAYELCNIQTNFIQFDDDITLMGSVDGGMFFGTGNEIVFAKGDPGKGYTFESKADYGVIFNTMTKINAPEIGHKEEMKTLLLFATQKGICIGGPGGSLENRTRETYDYTATDIGAALVRRESGIDQYIVTLMSA